MKTLKKLTLTAFLAIIVSCLSAQSPPHPNGGNAPGSGSTPVGGGAPIGGSLIIMLALGLGYSSKRIYNYRKRLLD